MPIYWLEERLAEQIRKSARWWSDRILDEMVSDENGRGEFRFDSAYLNMLFLQFLLKVYGEERRRGSSMEGFTMSTDWNIDYPFDEIARAAGINPKWIPRKRSLQFERGGVKVTPVTSLDQVEMVWILPPVE